MSAKLSEIGQVGCYLKDYGHRHLCEIPFEAAREWAAKIAPDKSSGQIGSPSEFGGKGIRLTFKDIVIDGHWENKRFVVVGYEHDHWVVLYNHDGKFNIGLVKS